MTEQELLFLTHFERFAEALNVYFERSPWSVREIAGNGIAGRGEHGAAERLYAVFLGPGRVGGLTVTGASDYALGKPHVRTRIDLRIPRASLPSTLTEFPFGVAAHVADATRQEAENAHRIIRDAVKLQRPGVPATIVRVKVEFSGSALAYLRHLGIAPREQPQAPREG